jgi:hypothetical protein
LAPLMVAYLNGLYLSAFLIAMVIVFSCLYHASRETRWLTLDTFFAWALVTNNAGLAVISDFTWPYFECALACCLAVAGFYFYKWKDDWEWHLICALITFFCQLSYLYRVV